ncbi:MAG: TolC family protein, partial [Ottowia sp.]|nr:TolC family protein [Ottowia sp.]
MKARALVRWLAAPLWVATLAACSFVPKYEQPAAPVSATWPDSAGAQVEGGVAAADLPWQQFVHDAQLREVIQLALENNRDLRVAVQNIEQARAQYQIRRADQFPSVGVTGGATRSAPNPYA